MSGYTKLHSNLLTSTVWGESPVVCKVWVTLLAAADRDGIVEASIPGLARLASLTLAETEAALQKFLAADPYSRTPKYEGRRIEVVDGGWRLLNHAKYRERMSPDDIRERDRLRKQRYRDEEKSSRPTKNGTKRDKPEMSAKSDIADPDPDPDPEAKSSKTRYVSRDLEPLAKSLQSLYPERPDSKKGSFKRVISACRTVIASAWRISESSRQELEYPPEGYLMACTAVRSLMMSLWPADQKVYIPTLPVFIKELKYLDGISTFRRPGMNDRVDFWKEAELCLGELGETEAARIVPLIRAKERHSDQAPLRRS